MAEEFDFTDVVDASSKEESFDFSDIVETKTAHPAAAQTDKQESNVPAVKTSSLDRQLPYMTSNIQKTFSENPEIFSNESARTTYYNQILKPYGYIGSEDYTKVYSALEQGDPYRQQHLKQLNEELNSGKFPVRALDPIPEVTTALSIAGEQASGGIKTIAETGPPRGPHGYTPQQWLHIFSGLTKIGFGFLSATNPEVAAFNLASKGVEEKNPGATEILSPISKNLEEKYAAAGMKPPTWKSDFAELGDLGIFMGTMMGIHGAPKLADKINDRVAINDFNKGLNDLTPQQIDDIYNKEQVAKRQYVSEKQSGSTTADYADWLAGLKQKMAAENEKQQNNLKTALARNTVPEHLNELDHVSLSKPISDLPVGLSVNYQGKDGYISHDAQTGEIIFNSKGKQEILGGGGDTRSAGDLGLVINEGKFGDQNGKYFVEKTEDGHTIYKIRNDGSMRPVYEGEKANPERRAAIISKALERSNDEASMYELSRQARNLETDIQKNKNNPIVSALLSDKKTEIENQIESVHQKLVEQNSKSATNQASLSLFEEHKTDIENAMEQVSEQGKEILKEDLTKIKSNIKNLENDAVQIRRSTEMGTHGERDGSIGRTEEGSGVGSGEQGNEIAEPQQQSDPTSPTPIPEEKVVENEASYPDKNAANFLSIVLVSGAKKAFEQFPHYKYAGNNELYRDALTKAIGVELPSELTKANRDDVYKALEKAVADKVSEVKKNRNLATDGSGSKKESSSENSKTVREPKKKIRRQGVPKSRRKIRDPRYLEALKVEPSSPYDQVLQHFISGGEISSEAIHKLFDGSPGEKRAKFGIIGKNGPSIEELAHTLWESRAHDKFDTQDYANAVEEVLQEHNGRKSMVEEMLDRHGKSTDDYYSKEYGEIPSEYIDQAHELIETLSDDEIQKIADDLTSDGYREQLIDAHAEKTEPSREGQIAEANDLIIEKEKQFNSAKSKYDKAKSALTENGQQNQKDIFGKSPEEEMLFKNDIGEQEKIVADLKGKMDEAASELKDAQEKKDLIGQQSMFKDVADFIRKGKIDDDIAMASVPFAKEIWNGAIEILARTIEAGGNLADAIRAGLDHIQSSNWYKNLKTKGDQTAAEKKFMDFAQSKELEKRVNPNKGQEVTKDEVEQILSDIKNSQPDFKERLKTFAKTNVLSRIATSAIKTFHPFIGGTKNNPSIYTDARLTAITLREKLGEMQHANEVSAAGSKERMLFFDKMDQADQIRFIANLERGVSLGTPEMDALTKQYRDRMDNVFKQISDIKDVPYIEDYFPHFWKDPDSARRIFSKKPIEGSKSFLKQRFYSDIIEGMKNGLELISTNPEELARLAEINANKFTMGNDFFHALKEQGLVKYYKAGEQPKGWALVDDPLFKRLSMFNTPEGEAAMKVGGWYMPEEAADIVSRYTSRGVVKGDLINVIRNYNNFMNQAQLGISFFHGMTTTIDAAVTANALGLDAIARRQVAHGLWQIAKGTTLIPNMLEQTKLGAKVIRDYRSGVMNDEVRQMIVANARTGADVIYHTDMYDNFKRAIAKNNYGEALLRAVPAVFDVAAKPIFEYMVPRLKVGGFIKVAQNELAKLENPTQEQINRTIQRSWDDIENRLGQMTYDNLFWDKTTKDVAFLVTRSVGWNLGTARAFATALADVPSTGKTLVQGKGISPRTAWAIALVGQTALMGAITTYLSTGQGPQDWRDYFYPRTGEKNKDGSDKRVQYPTYMKEVFNTYEKGLYHTAIAKASPIVNEVGEIIENKDFYGEQVYDPLDPAYKRGLDVLKYTGKQLVPFGFRNIPGEEATPSENIRKKIGVMPAPMVVQTGIDKSSIYKMIEDIDSDIEPLMKKLKKGKLTPAEGQRLGELQRMKQQEYLKFHKK